MYPCESPGGSPVRSSCSRSWDGVACGDRRCAVCQRDAVGILVGVGIDEMTMPRETPLPRVARALAIGALAVLREGTEVRLIAASALSMSSCFVGTGVLVYAHQPGGGERAFLPHAGSGLASPIGTYGPGKMFGW